MKCLDIASIMGIISKRTPHLRHRLLEHRIARKHVGPNLRQKLGFRYRTLMILHKIPKQLHCARLQSDYFFVAIEEVDIRKEVEGRKVQSVRSACGHASIRPYSYPIASMTPRLTARLAGHHAASKAINVTIGSVTSTSHSGK